MHNTTNCIVNLAVFHIHAAHEIKKSFTVVHSLMRLLDHVPGLGLTLTLMRLLDHVPRLGLGLTLTLTLMWLLDHVPRFLRVHILSCLISHVAELSQKTVVNTRYVRVFSRYNSHAYKSQIFYHALCLARCFPYESVTIALLQVSHRFCHCQQFHCQRWRGQSVTCNRHSVSTIA